MKIKTPLSQGAHLLSDAVTTLGTLAGSVVHRSSQTERQLHIMEVELRRQTCSWPLCDRAEAFSYGMDSLFGIQPCSYASPEVKCVVDAAVAKAKAA